MPDAPFDLLPFTLPPAQQAAIAQAYATPPRAYHSLAHVGEVLKHYVDVAAGPGWTKPHEIAASILYHDAIYLAGAKDNEARSGVLARDHFAEWPRADLDIDRVVALIDMTARHGTWSPSDFPGEGANADARLFLDCDMAILGASPEVFDAYDRGIAAEYRGAVPGWLFAINRKRFLKGLLARERIYVSAYFHERLDAQARSNLRRAITTKR
jgi:predicted metal-dependent HD superfamily phosphohydrolase